MSRTLLAAITIGWAPRPDLTDPIRGRLPTDRAELRELGALDDVAAAELPPPGDTRADCGPSPLATRLRDGSAVTLDEAFIAPHVQRAIATAESSGAVATILLCAGRFPGLHARRPLLRPFGLAAATLSSLGMTKIGVLVPVPAQHAACERKWRAAGFAPVVRVGSLWAGPTIFAADLPAGLDAIVLDYVGHPAASVRRFRPLLPCPVVDLGGLAASAIIALIS